MQLLAPAVVLAVVLPSLAQGPSFTVNTPPGCPQCGPCRLSWTENPPNPPWLVSITPAGQTGSNSLVNPVTTNETSITFDAPLQLNQQFTVVVTDGTGSSQFSSPIPVVAGASSSCVNDPNFNPFPQIPNATAGTGSSGGSSSASSGSSSSGSSSPTFNTPGGASSTSGSKSSATSTSTSPSGTQSQKSSASTLTAGLLGSVSLVFAALLA